MEKPIVKFKYVFSPEYNPKYVNGAYGGVSTQGEIIISFYLERKGLPKYHEFYVEKDGKMTEKSIEPEDHRHSMVRVVQTGIVLDLTHAKSIHNWLGGKIDELEKMQTEQKKTETESSDE